MALRTILTTEENEEALRKHSRPVTAFNERLHGMLDDMVETLRESGGVGLAAPQDAGEVKAETVAGGRHYSGADQPGDHRHRGRADRSGGLLEPARHLGGGHKTHDRDGPGPGSGGKSLYRDCLRTHRTVLYP